MFTSKSIKDEIKYLEKNNVEVVNVREIKILSEAIVNTKIATKISKTRNLVNSLKKLTVP